MKRTITIYGLIFWGVLLTSCSVNRPPAKSTMVAIHEELRLASSKLNAGNPGEPPDAVSRALMPPLNATSPRPATPNEPRFDLAVSNAPAQQVFLQIVTGTRYSMLVPPEVTGNVALNLKNVTVLEALDALRDLYGYEYTLQGTRIQIQPNTLQTRIFQINYLATKRSGNTHMRVTSGSISNNTAATGASASTSATSTAPTTTTPTSTGNSSGSNAQSSYIATDSEHDFWGQLRETLAAIVGTDGNRKVIVNPLSGVVAVRGFPQDLRNTENYLRLTQLIIERQVMIEAKIIEVQLSEGFSSGVNWAAFRSGNSSGLSMGQTLAETTLATTGVIGNPSIFATAGATLINESTNPGGILGLAFQSPSFAALLQFLETQGNVQVLSSPRIATINNQKAVLKVGTDEFFVTSVSTSTTTSGTNNVTSPTIAVQPFFSGIALDVTPQIDEHDGIILHLHPSVSVVAEKQKNVNLGQLGVFQLPLAASSVSESDSVVRVKDGYIVAIGGLMKQQQSDFASGLPGATQSSPLSNLLGQKSRSSLKSELVILLKPTILHSESSWQADTLDTQQRLQRLEPHPTSGNFSPANAQ